MSVMQIPRNATTTPPKPPVGLESLKDARMAPSPDSKVRIPSRMSDPAQLRAGSAQPTRRKSNRAGNRRDMSAFDGLGSSERGEPALSRRTGKGVAGLLPSPSPAAIKYAG